MDRLAIWVSTVEGEVGPSKAIFRPDAEAILEQVSIEKLRQSLGLACNGLTKILDDIKSVGRFRLKEVTVQVEISAEGGVQLIGTATLGGKGAISMTFGE